MTIPDPADLPGALTASAIGIPTRKGAADLIIGCGCRCTDDFTSRFITSQPDTDDPGAMLASIDWETAITALDAGELPCNNGEPRVLRLAASIAAGTPVSLSDTLGGIDDRNATLAIQAVACATGYDRISSRNTDRLDRERFCYAETFAERWQGIPGHHFEHGFDVTLRPQRVDQPLRWKRPKRIFVTSMSDLFHESVPDAFIAEVFAVMARAHWHTFQLLTKRHGRMRSLLSRPLFRDSLAHLAPWPLPNVWLGVSAEDQKWWDVRVPTLLETPAAVRFVSAEPLLGPIDKGLDRGKPAPDWLIIGGESGSGARPMTMEWVRGMLGQCQRPGFPRSRSLSSSARSQGGS